MSFQQGVSGLNAASRNLEVIGNNVANASTVGAKASRAEFADIYARASSGNGAVGLGVAVGAVTQQFSQGSISASNNPLDVAINGAGFFQVMDPNGNMLYSRNGQFEVNSDGFVVNAQGQKLVGIPSNYSVGQIPGKAQPLLLPTAGTAPKATANVNLEINLDARGKITDPVATPVNFAVASSFNSSTSITVFDAKGDQVAMTYFFQKTAPDTWNVYGAANGEPVLPDGSPSGAPLTQVKFSGDGRSPLSPTVPLVIDVPLTGAGTPNETQPIVGLKVDMTTMTQFGSPFGPTALSQDGFAAGRLNSIAIGDNGNVTASYSSGQSASIAHLELANFRNNQGLRPMGGNAWASSSESGEPVLGVPGGGNLGLLKSSALEDSNVDLTGELVSMMVAQRVYQANAQTIKTQDAVLQTLVNLR